MSVYNGELISLKVLRGRSTSLGGDYVRGSYKHADVLALVEAVEAAHAFLLSEDESGDLYVALKRFDFGAGSV